MEEEWVAGVWDEEGSGSAFSNFTEMDNLTLTCAARNIQGPIELPYSSTLTITVRAIQSLYYLFIILAGSFLNTVVIILVAKYKKLQNLSFLVSLQVVVINLMWSVSILALVPSPTSSDHKTSSKTTYIGGLASLHSHRIQEEITSFKSSSGVHLIALIFSTLFLDNQKAVATSAKHPARISASIGM